jgi:hypothetical protein
MNLSTLDPNLVAGLVTVVGGLVTWLYRKATGEKQRSIVELLDEAITHEVGDALDDGETLDTIEARLTKAALALGRRIGIKVPKQTVGVAVQWGVFKFRQLVKEREANQRAAKELPTQAEKLGDAAAGVIEAFTPKGDVPTLDVTVEVVKE